MKHIFDIDIINTDCQNGICSCSDLAQGKLLTVTETIQEFYTTLITQICDKTFDTSQILFYNQMLNAKGKSDYPGAEIINMSTGFRIQTDLAKAQKGENVIDLGCGAGTDCFLMGASVGVSGHVTGIDITHEMISVARLNAEQLNSENITFILGQMESVSKPDGCADLVTSNNSIILASNKDRVLMEIFRLLKPGGRFVISEIFATQNREHLAGSNQNLLIPSSHTLDLYTEFIDLIKMTGFNEVEILVNESVADIKKTKELNELRILSLQGRKNLF